MQYDLKILSLIFVYYIVKRLPQKQHFLKDRESELSAKYYFHNVTCNVTTLSNQ